MKLMIAIIELIKKIVAILIKNICKSKRIIYTKFGRSDFIYFSLSIDIKFFVYKFSLKQKIIILFFVHLIIAHNKYYTLFSFILFIILIEFFYGII